MESIPDITVILNRISAGDGQAIDKLMSLVYDELRRQASIKMAGERADHTLQATALVNDVYVRLLGSKSKPDFQSQGHFFAAAAKAMQRIPVDHARSKARLKRGGDRFQVDLTDVSDNRTNHRRMSHVWGLPSLWLRVDGQAGSTVSTSYYFSTAMSRTLVMQRRIE